MVALLSLRKLSVAVVPIRRVWVARLSTRCHVSTPPCRRLAWCCQQIFVPRLRCGRCGVTHALLRAFVLAWRLDVAETIGTVIAEVVGGRGGVRPAAAGLGGPCTTARGWARRFPARARELQDS